MSNQPSLLARKKSAAGRALRRPLRSPMLSDLAWREIARSLKLSPRELQIVRATFDDQEESTIAEGLGIALRTVHTHIERLHRKLEVTDRVQLVLCIMSEFLRLTIAPEANLPPICPHETADCCPLRD